MNTLQKSIEIFNKIQYRRQGHDSYWCIFFSTQLIFVLKKKSLHKNDYFPSAKIKGRTYRSCIIAQDFHATDQIGHQKKNPSRTWNIFSVISG